MFGRWRPFFGLTALLIGCATPGPNLKSPQAEQFVVPPEDDARFSQPMTYPKELLNKPPIKAATTAPNAPQRPMIGGAGGPGGPGGF